MRYFIFILFFSFSLVASSQVPDEIKLLRSQGFLNTVPILNHDSISGMADQSHGKCVIYIGHTKEGLWNGSLAFLSGDESAPAEKEKKLANELTIWVLLHENAHCLWYSRGGPKNFSIKNYSLEQNIKIGSVILYHRSMSEIVLSESFADIYASILFKKIYPQSDLLNKISAARYKAASQKYDNLHDVNIASDSIFLVEKASFHHLLSPEQLFLYAARLASHNTLDDFNTRSPRIKEILLSEKHFLSLSFQWWEGFAEDQECWWKNNQFDISVFLLKELGCSPPAPYSAASFSFEEKLRKWFKKEEQHKNRIDFKKLFE